MADIIGFDQSRGDDMTSEATFKVNQDGTMTLLDVYTEHDPLRPANRCCDFDEDCQSIADGGGCTHCWLHDPEQGWCPFLPH